MGSVVFGLQRVLGHKLSKRRVEHGGNARDWERRTRADTAFKHTTGIYVPNRSTRTNRPSENPTTRTRGGGGGSERVEVGRSTGSMGVDGQHPRVDALLQLRVDAHVEHVRHLGLGHAHVLQAPQ